MLQPVLDQNQNVVLRFKEQDPTAVDSSSAAQGSWSGVPLGIGAPHDQPSSRATVHRPSSAPAVVGDGDHEPVPVRGPAEGASAALEESKHQRCGVHT